MINEQNSVTFTENNDGSGARYTTDVESAGYRSQRKTTCVSCHTEELYCNKTVCG